MDTRVSWLMFWMNGGLACFGELRAINLFHVPMLQTSLADAF